MEHERAPTPTSTTRPEADPPAILGRFIGRLSAGYRRLREAGPSAGPHVSALEGRLDALGLADAALRYSAWPPANGARPPQVAVLGPTQTGKSTLVNVLLGHAAAEVSPLAGFTVHPQGFWVGGAGRDQGWMSALFPDWRRVQPGGLTRDDLASYALTPVEPPPRAATGESLFADVRELPTCVVWDTPDFDSLAARQYSAGVLEVAALADLYLLVLSKEKYSDLSVWRLLELLAPLGRPLVIALNKLTPDAEEALVHSLRGRLQERGAVWGDVRIVTLPYEAGLAAGGQLPATLAPPLRQAVSEGLRAELQADVSRAGGVCALLRRHWDAWLAPVRAEHEARAAWERLVETAATKFMAAYTRDYLEHPQRYDAFRRAAVELLSLLEIPHVGGLMTRARQLVTWPARQIIAAAQGWRREQRRPRSALHSLGAEAAVLVDTLDALLTGLQRDIARLCAPATPGYAVWQALERRLEIEQTRLREVFEAAIQAHHAQMTREISATANRLYAELRKSPARLAALRTARATIDVASVILAVKTGGLTPLDAVWAPATFAVTSLLMEGVAGLEHGREVRRLKAQQRAAVEQEFLEQVFSRELKSLAEALDTVGLTGINAEEMRTATQALATWEKAAAPARVRAARVSDGRRGNE